MMNVTKCLDLLFKRTESFDAVGHRGSYTSGHFIWNLWNEPLASFINFVWNDHECKILFIIWLFKWDFIALKVEIISIENITLSRTASWRYAPVTKCYVTCGHTIFMTWRYPLKNWLLIFFVSLRYEWKKNRRATPAIRKCARRFFLFIPQGNEKTSTVNSYNLISYHFHTKSKGKQS